MSVKKNDRRGLSANGGFSLVELLVAVIILGIIVAPLLHTFVTGIYTSARSRKIGDATLAAQNISETIEANSMSKIIDGTAFGGTKASPDPKASDIRKSSYYLMTLNSVQAGKSSFTADIKFDAMSADSDPASWYKSINSEKISDYTKMDAVYVQSSEASDDPDQLAMVDFKNFVPVTIGTPTVNRVIALIITTDAGNLNAELKYTYNFSYSTMEIGSSGQEVTKSGTRTFVKKYTLFPQGFNTASGYPNIYVLYNPWYKGTFEGVDRVASTDGINNSIDTIRIFNNFSEDGSSIDVPVPVNVFLVKQKTSNTTIELESSYMAMIVLAQSANRTTENTARVYSNAGENSMNESAIVTAKYREQIGRYQYGTIEFAAGTDIVSRSAKNRIFKVTITIKDDSKDVCTMTTTKLG